MTKTTSPMQVVQILTYPKKLFQQMPSYVHVVKKIFDNTTALMIHL